MLQYLPRLRHLAAATLAVMAGAAQADVTFYSSATDFMSQISKPSTDSFYDLSGMVGTEVGSLVNRTTGNYGYGLYAYSTLAGRADTLWVGGTAKNPTITSNVVGSIVIVDKMIGGANAFGAYISAASGNGQFQNGTIKFEILDAAGNDKIYSFTPTAADQGSFVGVISTSALKIINAWVDTTTTGGTQRFAVMDSMTLGMAAAPVPEPASYALMFGGLVALGAVARRRKAASA